MNNKQNRVPKFGNWLLGKFLYVDEFHEKSGDLEEVFEDYITGRGRIKACFWYWGQVLKTIPLFTLNSIIRGTDMFRNYVKITLRNIFRFKTYSFINIFGLSIGITAFVLITRYVHSELTFENFHANADQIYKMGADFKTPSGEFHIGTSSWPMAGALRDNYPEILAAVRFRNNAGTLVRYEDKKFYEDRFFYTEPDAFDVFSFTLIDGEINNPFEKPNALVITSSAVQKYFENVNPVGKVVILDNNIDNQVPYTITAVMEDLPENTHMQVEFLAKIDGKYENQRNIVRQWIDSGRFHTYVYLPESLDHKEFESKIANLVHDNIGEALDRSSIKMTPHLLPIKQLHLTPGRQNELGTTNSETNIYIIFSIAIIIVLIASINFMNLATAKSMGRSKEIGVRKVLGAFRIQLFRQFMVESISYAMFALVISLILVKLFLPVFNSVINKDLSINYLSGFATLPLLVCFAFLVGLLSGSYPALFLSSLNPVSIIKGRIRGNLVIDLLRKVLVTVQFAASIILIIGTTILYQQLQYFQSKDLGFQPQQIVVISLKDRLPASQYQAIKNEFLRDANITSVSFSKSTPGLDTRSRTMFSKEGASDAERQMLFYNSVDHDFVKTFGISVASGRDFSKEFSGDTLAVIINEQLVERFGWEDPVGETLVHYGLGETTYKVIGVVKDYHFDALQTSINPYVFRIDQRDYNFASIKMKTDIMSETLSYIEDVWNKFSPDHPLEYSFVDENFEKNYESETRLGNIFGYFSGLAVFLACLGLFGLTSFAVEKRTKEVGIRKILGSSSNGIVLLLGKEFAKWVLLANMVAWPVAYYVMNNYLDTIAFRVDITMSAFLFAGAATFLIAVITVSFQSLKSAFSNPVIALRHD